MEINRNKNLKGKTLKINLFINVFLLYFAVTPENVSDFRTSKNCLIGSRIQIYFGNNLVNSGNRQKTWVKDLNNIP